MKKKKDVLLYSDNAIFKTTDLFGHTVTIVCSIIILILIALGIFTLFHM